LKSIQLKLGQKEIRTTMIYFEANEDHADEAIRKANEMRQKLRELELAEAAKNPSIGGGKGEDLKGCEAT
jgi:hypothetical protein